MSDNPFVMCLTNAVAANFTANVLLAVGAKPAMVEDPSEAAELAAHADAVLINVGTVFDRQAAAMRAAISACRSGGVPWVLDPVAAHCLSYRRALVAEFCACGPSLIRGNHDEITYLLNSPEITIGPDQVMLSTGEEDRIYVGRECVAKISGGVPVLQQVTATGCAQGGLCAAWLGRGKSPRDVAVEVSRLEKIAGELAAKVSRLPGSFQTAWIDALAKLCDSGRRI